jgi:hypothetical protein
LYADTFDVDFKNKTHEVIKYAVEIGLMHIKRTMKTTIEMLTANPPEKGSYGNFDTAEWIKSNPGIFITEDADELINKAFENDNA